METRRDTLNERLSEATLADLPLAVERPAYARADLVPGIVHFGPGAFHRAHQAAYADAVLADDPRWGIAAVALKYAIMTPAEYRRFHASTGKADSERRMYDAMLISGWGQPSQATFLREIERAASRVTTKISASRFTHGRGLASPMVYVGRHAATAVRYLIELSGITAPGRAPCFRRRGWAR